MIESFRDHPFILKIKHKVKVSTTFSFHPVSESLVKKVVKELPTDEAAAGEILLTLIWVGFLGVRFEVGEE